MMGLGRLGLGLGRLGAPSGGIDAAVEAFFARAGALDATHVNAINALAATWRSNFGISTLSDLGDACYLLANQTSLAARTNLFKNAHDATLIGAPTFTTDRGFSGNGTTTGIDTNFTPNAGVKFTQNNGGITLLNGTSSAVNTGIHCGNGETHIACRFSDTNAYGRVNNAGGAADGVSANVQGYWTAVRRASNDREFYKNKVSIQSAADASAAPSANDFYICGFNNAGAFGAGSTNQLRAFIVHKGLTDSEIALLVDPLEVYMDAIGAGVL